MKKYKLLGAFLFGLCLSFSSRADLVLVSGALNAPFDMKYAGDTSGTKNSTRSVFIFPKIGLEGAAYISALNSGLYVGAGITRLVEFNQGFGGNNASVSWTGYYPSARFYLGNLLMRKPASGPWAGVDLGRGSVAIDFDNKTHTDLTYSGKWTAIRGGYAFDVSVLRVSPYFVHYEMKYESSGGGFIYRANAVGLEFGLSI